MGLGIIDAVIGAAGGVFADQYKDFIMCPEIGVDVLVTKGQRSTSGRTANHGSDNLITNGSVIVVNEGQAMIIVDNGAIVEYCDKPGQFVWNNSTEPSIFTEGLSQGIKKSFERFKKRVTFGAHTGTDQRVYYFNTKKIIGNKYGTASPIPFPISEPRFDANMRCNGEYSYRIVDPILFYKNISGAVEENYVRSQIDSQLKSELLTALQPTFYRIGGMGIRYSAITGHVQEIAKILNEELSATWGESYGIEVSTFGVNSVRLLEEDEKRIKDYQMALNMADPRAAAGRMAMAQANAMEAAAANTSAGPMMAFAGMNMAGAAGSAATTSLFQQAAAQQQQGFGGAGAGAAPGGWTCSCGTQNTGKFCNNCGKPKPAPEGSWICSCGAQNTGKFCNNCGKPKPAPAGSWKCECGTENTGKFCNNCGKPKPISAIFRCDKCGWQPADPNNVPKFCPECGDPFNDDDIVKQ